MAEEIYGNDERIEALWAIKAMEHAEVYFNVSPFQSIVLKHQETLESWFQILCSVDPKQIPRLSQNDDEIYDKFRQDFPAMNVGLLREMEDLKSTEMKAKWRGFCEEFKHVEDFSFATLIRLDSRCACVQTFSTFWIMVTFAAYISGKIMRKQTQW